MIPEAKQEAVACALREAFGVTDFEDIRLMTAGLSSALKFRIVVRGSPYLLRVIMRTDAINDPTRQFACMKAAADAGIAPGVRYANIPDRISITDFVEPRPFPRAQALARLPLTLQVVHRLPAIPRVIHTLDMVEGFRQKFMAAKILPVSETVELFDLYARTAEAYPRDDQDMVSCHNDLKPENILFDGDRVWLVDWEAAFINDRYADLALVANFVVTHEEEEDVYLRAYFGEPAGEYRRARFYLMKQALHMAYAMFLLVLGSRCKPIEWTEDAPDFRHFHDRIRAGAVNLGDDALKLQYGRVHMNRALQDMRAPRFNEALRVVSNHHAMA